MKQLINTGSSSFLILICSLISCSKEDAKPTSSAVPSTGAAVNITANSASLPVTLVTAGTVTIQSKGVCWGVNQNPTTSNDLTNDGITTGNFTSELTGLIPNTIYYVRSYVTISGSTTYGNQVSFKTLDLPAIYLRWTSSITPSSPSLSGFYFKEGKLFAGPYAYSTDEGKTWQSVANDGLFRTAIRLGGDLIVEKESPSSGTLYKYKTIDGTNKVLSVPVSHSTIAWDGVATAYYPVGKTLMRTTNNGTTWSSFSYPSETNSVAITGITMVGNLLITVESVQITSTNLDYVIKVSSDGGTTWAKSSANPNPIRVISLSVNELYAAETSTDTFFFGGAFFKLTIGATPQLTQVEFEEVKSASVRSVNRLSFGLFVSTSAEGYFMTHPVSGKLYKPSTTPAGAESVIATQNNLIIRAGSRLYFTPLPLKFYTTP
jgi:hypothetical protein